MIPRYKEIKAFTDVYVRSFFTYVNIYVYVDVYVRSYFVIIGDALTGFNQSF